jgi:hypothetical protein
MIFGHNTNVTVGGHKYHVQTEDAGPPSALIDTTVYAGGRVLYRRTNNYLDLLPLNPDRQAALKLRLDEQHRQMLEEIRSGALQLAPPAPLPESAKPLFASQPTARTPKPADLLAVELINAKSWLSGKRAALHLRVLDHSQHPVPAAKVTVSTTGESESHKFLAETDSAGEAHLSFDMPHLSAQTLAYGALVIEALHGSSHGHLRFHLKPRPRVPVNQ